MCTLGRLSSPLSFVEKNSECGHSLGSLLSFAFLYEKKTAIVASLVECENSVMEETANIVIAFENSISFSDIGVTTR